MAKPPALVQYAVAHPGHPAFYTEAGSGEAVLLIHGSLCDYRYWRWQMPQISKSYRVIAPSLRGCWPQAYQQADSGYSVATHTQDLVELVKELSPGRPVHVLGHSRGAQVALNFVLEAPDLCRTLTLADPGFRFDHEPPWEVFYAPAVALLERHQVEPALEQFIDTVNGAGTWHKMVSWFKDMVRANAYTLVSQIHESNLAVSLDAVRTIDCPVLLISGADSPKRYGTRQTQLEHALRDVRHVTIKQAAHGMNLANPRAFNRYCLEFFSTKQIAEV
ncbi:MAG: alpha/beta hydrolase [Alcaligenaceae bacterium]|nr:alpha/beta hydrolase [Alcaligenaceae bacterium]